MVTPPSTTLHSRWTTLYTSTLPALARARDPAQPSWPVALDHCFARIILDNTVGARWDTVIKKPAVRHMSAAQLEAAIGIGERIAEGEVDLAELDRRSLEWRGKGGGKIKYRTELRTGRMAGSKRKATAEVVVDADAAPPARKRQSTLPFSPSHKPPPTSSCKVDVDVDDPAIQSLLHKISTHPSLTPYRCRLYSTLLSVPRGRYTTYAALSDFLGSSARAVGNGMRNNPFAPGVPCHRVLASDGSIGGFGGSWGKEGENAGEKYGLLREEGVRFDGRGQVVGERFRGFVDLSVVPEGEGEGVTGVRVAD